MNNITELKPESSKLPTVSIANATAPASERVISTAESKVLLYKSLNKDKQSQGDKHLV